MTMYFGKTKLGGKNISFDQHVAALFSQYSGCLSKHLLIFTYKLSVQGEKTTTKLLFFLFELV